LYGECTGAVYPAEEICDGLDNDCDSTIDEDNVCGNIALNKPYVKSEPSPNYPDTGNIELTDGDYATENPTDSAWVGWGFDELEIIVDLESNYDVNGILVHTLEDLVWGIYYPPIIEVFTSNDGIDYTSQGFMINTGGDFVLDGFSADAQYLKLVIERYWWTFIDEIEAYGTLNVVIDNDEDGYNEYFDCDDNNPDVNPGATEVYNGIDDDCDGLIDNVNNVALNKPYTKSLPNETYPDTNDVELTDGKYAPGEPYDEEWVGWGDEDLVIIVDLENTHNISLVRTHTLENTVWGIYYPPSIEVFTSENGVDYTSQGFMTNTDGYFLLDGLLSVDAKYVKLAVERYWWTFIDEVEVYAT